jgi:hypothetical protein
LGSILELEVLLCSRLHKIDELYAKLCSVGAFSFGAALTWLTPSWDDLPTIA